jgi:hypothetical protein
MEGWKQNGSSTSARSLVPAVGNRDSLHTTMMHRARLHCSYSSPYLTRQLADLTTITYKQLWKMVRLYASLPKAALIQCLSPWPARLVAQSLGLLTAPSYPRLE